MDWTVERLNAVVDAELDALPNDLQARFLRVFEMIEAYSFQKLPHDAVKHLEDKLWEIRVKGKSGISRAIYVTATGKRIVIIRVFVKQTQKTPQRELELARQRAKEIGP